MLSHNEYVIPKIQKKLQFILSYEIATFCEAYSSIIFLCCIASIPTLHTVKYYYLPSIVYSLPVHKVVVTMVHQGMRVVIGWEILLYLDKTTLGGVLSSLYKKNCRNYKYR